MLPSTALAEFWVPGHTVPVYGLRPCWAVYFWCLSLSSWLSCAAVQTGMASAANRYTTVIHIHVRDFMFFSSLLREWRFRLARSGIPDENLQQVHAPGRRGIPIPDRQEYARSRS